MSRKRKGLTVKDKLDLWEKWNGICNKCGLPINKHKRGELEWGHYPIPKSMGGSDDASNRAPEHKWCNREDGSKVVVPMAAKAKRVAIRNLEKREPKMRFSRKFDGTLRRWNPITKKREDVT